MSVSSYKPLLDAALQNDTSKIMSAQRQVAFDKLSLLGFPTRKNDDWKYTSVKPLVDTIYKFPGTDLRDMELPKDVLKKQTVSVTFLNGRWKADLSTIPAIAGLTISSLSSSDQMSNFNSASFQNDPLDLLNTSLVQDGVLVELALGTQIEPVIYINHVYANLDQATIAATRTVLRLKTNAKCTIVEKFYHIDQSQVFSSHISDIELESGAELVLLKDCAGRDEYCHVGHSSVKMAEKARCQTFLLQQGGRLARHNITMQINGKDALAEAHGVYLLRNHQHSDQRIVIDHQAPGSSSRQVFKGMMDDRSRGVFNGKIFIRRGAQGTDARQLNKNLLLSSDAEADTKPELNIDTDDVGCSHGATVGQLDADELFYLQSRGLTLASARELLCRAFAADVLTQILHPELRTLAEERLDSYFTQAKKASGVKSDA